MDVGTALEFARERTHGVILTIGGDGRPHASNVSYATWGGAVHVSITEDRVKARNVVRDPRTGMHITSRDFWSWVVLEGEAVLSGVTTDPDDEAAALLRRVYEAIAGPHPDWDEFDQAMIEDRRLVLSLPVDRAYGQVAR
jgi:PPOX class probable F420-dependent enzyme